MGSRTPRLRAAAALLAVAIALTGCPLLAGLPILPDLLGRPAQKPGVLTTTSVGLAEADYEVVRTHVVGESRGLKLLLILTLVSPTYAKAFQDLYEKAALPENRAHALVHLVHERSEQNFLLFSLPRITVRADVVEFTAAAPAPAPAPAAAPAGPGSEEARHDPEGAREQDVADDRE